MRHDLSTLLARCQIETTYCDRVIGWNAVLGRAYSSQENTEARINLYATLWITSRLHGPRRTDNPADGRHTAVPIRTKLVPSRTTIAGSL